MFSVPQRQQNVKITEGNSSWVAKTKSMSAQQFNIATREGTYLMGSGVCLRHNTVYRTIEFVYLSGAITAGRYLDFEILPPLYGASACFQWYKMEIYDRRGVRLRLKVQLLKAEVVETILYGCMTWSPNKPDYDRLRRVHHSMLLRCLGCRKQKRDDHTLSFADALAKTASERIEAIVRKRRALFAGFVARMGEERLPQRVILRSLLGVRATQGGKRRTGWLM